MTNLFGKAMIVLGAVVFVFLAASSAKLFENVGAGEIVVCQDVVDGELHWFTSPGLKGQYFGDCTHYQKSTQLWFSADEGEAPIKIRFNDNGHAFMHGSIRINLPTDQPTLTKIHSAYGSQEAVEDQLVYTVIGKVIYMTGSLMSSTESAAERRASLLNYIEDQATFGVYRTAAHDIKTLDPLSGEEKTVKITEIISGSDGAPLRQESSPLTEYGIRVSNFSIMSIEYDERVEAQIEQQRNAIMQVQTAMANAKRAEQDAITAEQQGRADAATAKWTQEAINAKEIALAEKDKRIKELDAQQAAEEKKAAVLRGQGEAEAQRLKMQANGALEQKLQAYVETQRAWAEAFAKFQGNVVPGVVMGGNGGGSGNNAAATMMEMLAIKAAKDLSVSTTPGK